MCRGSTGPAARGRASIRGPPTDRGGVAVLRGERGHARYHGRTVDTVVGLATANRSDRQGHCGGAAACGLPWRRGSPGVGTGKAWCRLRDPQATIDLGGLAKGWIADRLAEELKSAGYADFLIDLGGNVVMHGNPSPSRDWIIAISNPSDLATAAVTLHASSSTRSSQETTITQQHPQPSVELRSSTGSQETVTQHHLQPCVELRSPTGRQTAVTQHDHAHIVELRSFQLLHTAVTQHKTDDVVELRSPSPAIPILPNVSVVTSGIYERRFVANGTVHHHILDPHTGRPARTDPASTTVVARTSLGAEGYSTTLLALGSTRAARFVESHPQILAALLIRDDGSMSLH